MADHVFELPVLESPSGLDGLIRSPAFDLEAERAEAQAAGHAKGFAAGIEEGRAHLAEGVAALQAAAAALGAERERVSTAVEAAAVQLALQLAEQAIAAALAVEPERVVDVVRGALRRLVERGRVTILVHPDDLDRLRQAAPGLVAELGGIEHCEVQAERRVSPGSAIVRTREGEVDATIATKLERAREILEEQLRA